MTHIIAYKECSEQRQTIHSYNHVYCVAPVAENYIEKVNTFLRIEEII